MKQTLLLFAFCSIAAPLFAQPVGNLWNDTSWWADGQNTVQAYGYYGLSYLGKIYGKDSVQNALAVGESGGSSWIENKHRLDTITQYFAPGQKVIRCNLSGTGRGDYVILGSPITVLYATDTPFVFDTVFIINPQKYNFVTSESIVADFDSSDTESLLVFADEVNSTQYSNQVLYFKGGVPFDTIPQVFHPPMLGDGLTIGNVRDKSHQFLCSVLAINVDTTIIYLNPLGHSFSITPSDSVICLTPGAGGGTYTGGFLIDDADGDSIEDIFIGFNNQVLIYKGGAKISPQPTYFINANPSYVDPLRNFSPTGIYDVGNFVSKSYRSILITKPDYGGDLYSEPGALWLYNIGSALKDSCVAYAIEATGSGARLGSCATGIGKYPGEKLDGFMVSELEPTNLEFANGRGAIIAFHGDSTLGTMTATHEGLPHPQLFNLSQNYPNPFTTTTSLTFSVSDPRLVGKEVTLNLYDALGRYVKTLFRSTSANGYQYDIGMSAEGLPEGIYFYRLVCGGSQLTKMMNVLK